MNSKLSVSTSVPLDIDKVWKIWNEPFHIKKWCSGHPDWHTTKAKNDLKVGGKLETRMEAKDGSMGFDMSNTYDEILENKLIRYHMEDGRVCIVTFDDKKGKVTITQSFDPDDKNALEIQKEGWQNIMNNFKSYIESINHDESTS